MKLPRHINVLGQKVPVLRKIPVEYKNLSDNSGLYFYDEKAIWIRRNICPNKQLKTLFHEIGHAIQNRGGLDCLEISDDAKEIMAEQFATVFYELIFETNFYEKVVEQLD